MNEKIKVHTPKLFEHIMDSLSVGRGQEMANNMKIIDRKRYVVLECQFAREWEIVRESRHGVTSEEAQEIVDYWLKYKQITAERIMIVEVPSIVKRDY